MSTRDLGDYTDLNIRWRDHPKYKVNKIIEDDVIEVIVQKLEMLLFTKTGDVMGEAGYDFGADIEYYLWKTSLSNNNLKQKIMDSISKFVPELALMGYDLTIDLFEGDYMDWMKLNFVIKGYNVSFIFN